MYFVLDALSQSRDRKSLIRIIGIGSPFGDDAVGLEAARILAEAPPPDCEVIAADRPGATLLDLIDGAEAAILVDAVQSGNAPGVIHEFDFDELDRANAYLFSSHDLGLVTAIQLARKLDRAPARGRIIGLEVSGRATAQPESLSSEARAALGRVIDHVRMCATKIGARERQRFIVSGIVQGVGMRPFVWRLATSLQLTGFVRNTTNGVEIEVEGNVALLHEFHRRLTSEAPPASVIAGIESYALSPIGEPAFRAMPSERGRIATTVPPDLATCSDCAVEITDRVNRRYRYPFSNCTACGPRFTVVRSLPYDREGTTLEQFPLCEKCQQEYLDPSDRRFRAEPIACPACGPYAWLETIWAETPSTGETEDCIAEAASILCKGGIVAVQGIGGIHLACDASNDHAVRALRAIKQRPRKPLAVMVESIASARRLAVISDDEAVLLASPAAPIVLLPKRDDSPIANSVAPGNDHVGIMIAYSPLHKLLLSDTGRTLVMTSANRPGEPLACNGDEARSVFGGKVDAFLLHNRPIHQRCDDSVWIVGPGGAQPIRLSRGSTPRVLEVPVKARRPVLATGGDIKNSFCLLSGKSALMSQYIGRLENLSTQQHFRQSLQHWLGLSGVKPAVAAHDLHPQSFAYRMAAESDLETIAIQHHHAHVAACLAEHGHGGPAIGIALDGAGYGLDEAIWGGEAMVADYHDFRRFSHLEYLPLPGGDAAVRRPDRIAAAFLIALYGSKFDDWVERLVGEQEASILAKMIERGINTFPTSSCGRLFDAVAALLGVCLETTYEAQAAIELEALARRRSPARRVYSASISGGVVQTGTILEGVIGDLEQRRSIDTIARAFHDTMAEVVAGMAADAREKAGIDLVALSGGCFQNRLLLAGSIERLAELGFTVLSHRRVPTNDGGLALGQAVIAAARLNPEWSGNTSCV
jgi:hydrogenase maturation protein HypF